MKKLYILFAVVFSFVASTNAWAQYRQGDEPLVTITAGQKVLIQNGREADMATSYLKWSATSGNVITDYLTDKIDDTSVMEFVDAGSGKFYLYNPANEAYVESVDQSFSGDFKLHWTTDITKAAPLTVSDEILAADISTPALMFYQELSLYNFPAWYLTAASPFTQSAAGFSYILSEGYEFYNAWVVYEAVSDGGKSYLESVFDAYFPAGFNDEIWSIGMPQVVSRRKSFQPFRVLITLPSQLMRLVTKMLKPIPNWPMLCLLHTTRRYPPFSLLCLAIILFATLQWMPTSMHAKTTMVAISSRALIGQTTRYPKLTKAT